MGVGEPGEPLGVLTMVVAQVLACSWQLSQAGTEAPPLGVSEGHGETLTCSTSVVQGVAVTLSVTFLVSLVSVGQGVAVDFSASVV